MEYRDVSVKHTTSPSRRDCSRQVVIFRVFQIPLPPPDCPVATPRSLARFSTRSFPLPPALRLWWSGAYLSRSKPARRNTPRF